MLGILRGANRFLHTAPFFSSLFHQCSSLANPSNSLKLIHAQLIKFGFNSNTFLSNRCIDLYVKSGSENDALKAFHEIPCKNIVSWNLYLKVLVKCFDVVTARLVFDEMPERDAVSWNTIISGYISCGLFDSAWEVFMEMQDCRIRPSEFTISLMLCCVQWGNYAKEMHGCVMRKGGAYSNLVVGNSLIDAYGKLGLLDYALAVFLSMEKVDVISWNSLISSCCMSGYEEFALHKLFLMRNSGFEVDEYTVSSVLTACSNLRNLEKGRQMFCLSIKLGFLCNTIVSSAAIALFSKCNRVDSAICIFKESCIFDSAIYNSVIACYASHNLEEDALELFVFSLRENIRPTEFTLSCVLDSAAVFIPVEQGSQLHSLVIKTGFELDGIVASSLVHMYGKYGLDDSALMVFRNMDFRDLIAWNTMILVLTHNGKFTEAISLFEKFLQTGLCPDQIAFSGALLACNYGRFLKECLNIFSIMQRYGVRPTNDHFTPLVDTMVQAGKVDEAIELMHLMQCEPTAFMWESILRACRDGGNINLIEGIAERMMELEPYSSVPYLILANTYEQMRRWESLVRVRNLMRKMIAKETVDCSWIGINGGCFSFQANQMIHYGEKNIYSVLELLMQEIWDEVA